MFIRELSRRRNVLDLGSLYLRLIAEGHEAAGVVRQTDWPFAAFPRVSVVCQSSRLNQEHEGRLSPAGAVSSVDIFFNHRFGARKRNVAVSVWQ